MEELRGRKIAILVDTREIIGTLARAGAREKEAAGPGPGSNALALPVHGNATRSKSKRVGVATKAVPPGRSSVEKEAAPVGAR